MTRLEGRPAKGRRAVRRILRRFNADARGATAVEFGLIGVPFLGLLLALFQTGLVFFANEGLEAAVQAAARNIYTGTAQTSGITTADQFRTNYMCPTVGPRILPSYIDCTKLIIDVRTANSMTGDDLSADFYNTTQQYCPGQIGDIVVVRVIYPMPAILPIITGNSTRTISRSFAGLVNNVPGNSGWKQLLLGTAVFQNEPNPSNNVTLPGC